MKSQEAEFSLELGFASNAPARSLSQHPSKVDRVCGWHERDESMCYNRAAKSSDVTPG
jgi:hypothetical protein